MNVLLLKNIWEIGLKFLFVWYASLENALHSLMEMYCIIIEETKTYVSTLGFAHYVAYLFC